MDLFALSRKVKWVSLFLCTALAPGCGTLIDSGHRAVLSKYHGGPQTEVLTPGHHWIGAFDRVDDFDVTFSTQHEEIQTVSQEGLQLSLKVAIIYRPIISQLYDLDVEIGTNYYDEVIGPEFRSATRGVFARHSYVELQKNNEKIEDEVEQDVRRRTAGKHVEIASVTLEQVEYAPEIGAAIRAKLVGEQEASRRKTQLEAERVRQQLELQNEAEREKMQAENDLRRKEKERKLAEEQAAIDKVQAETEAATKVTRAKADAEAQELLAKAHAAEKRAEATTLTPLMVQMHAYDALAKLGGNGTTIMLGDFSHVPNFLFPGLPGFAHGHPLASTDRGGDSAGSP